MTYSYYPSRGMGKIAHNIASTKSGVWKSNIPTYKLSVRSHDVFSGALPKTSCFSLPLPARKGEQPLLLFRPNLLSLGPPSEQPNVAIWVEGQIRILPGPSETTHAA